MNKHSTKKRDWPKPIKYTTERDFGYIYIIRLQGDFKGEYKIGRARNLKARLKQHCFEHKCRIALTYFALVDHHKRVESGIHKMFSAFRAYDPPWGREWFYLSHEMLEGVTATLSALSCKYSDYQRHVYLQMHDTDWLTVCNNGLTPEIRAEIEGL